MMADRALKILVVEDHSDTSKLMARLLQGHGHEVRTADGVGTALAAAGEESFDLLISDIGLPDGSGLELMRELRRQREIRGIALSGFGMEEDVRKSKEAGFSEQLVKPVTVNRLEQAIHKALGKQQG